MKNVSYFKRISDTAPMREITWDQVHQLIHDDREVKVVTENLRQAIITHRWDLSNPEHKRAYQQLKAQTFAGFMPGGLFLTRTVDDCENYSQVVHVDFDDLSLEEDQRLLNFITTDTSVCLSFLSPGGRGRKVFHHIKPKAALANVDSSVVEALHLFAFGKIRERYEQAGLLSESFDDAVSNLNRACYVSHDPTCHYKPHATAFEIDFDQESIQTEQLQQSEKEELYGWYAGNVEEYLNPLDSEAETRVRSLIGWLKEKKLSITVTYDQWIRVLFALKRSFTEHMAEDLGRQLSQMDSNFDERDFQKKFHQRIKPERAPTLATIFYYAKQLGFNSKHEATIKSIFLEEFIGTLAKHGWKIRHNQISSYRECFSDNRWRRLTDIDIDKIKVGVFGHRHRRDILEETINVIAPIYNPINDLINNLPVWDGNDHIAALAATLNSKEGKWPLLLLKRWLMGMLAGLTVNGEYNENVLILQGDQGDGKTRWVRRLFNEAFTSCGLEPERYFKQKQLNPEDKDDMLLLCTSFVVFFDELNSIVNRKADIEAFKNMTSATTHTIRRPYARHSEDLRRYASIIGTVNESQFLTDSTGNRRFWTIAVGKIEQDHTVNIPQVFAQALALVRAGERHYLNAEEVRELNEMYLCEFEVIKPEEELIRLCVESSDTMMLTATQVLGSINALTRTEMIKCGAANFGRMMQKHFKHRYVHSKKGRYYRVNVRQPGFETFLSSHHAENSDNNPLPNMPVEKSATDSNQWKYHDIFGINSSPGKNGVELDISVQRKVSDKVPENPTVFGRDEGDLSHSTIDMAYNPPRR